MLVSYEIYQRLFYRANIHILRSDLEGKFPISRLQLTVSLCMFPGGLTERIYGYQGLTSVWYFVSEEGEKPEHVSYISKT